MFVPKRFSITKVKCYFWSGWFIQIYFLQGNLKNCGKHWKSVIWNGKVNIFTPDSRRPESRNYSQISDAYIRKNWKSTVFCFLVKMYVVWNCSNILAFFPQILSSWSSSLLSLPSTFRIPSKLLPIQTPPLSNRASPVLLSFHSFSSKLHSCAQASHTKWSIRHW